MEGLYSTYNLTLQIAHPRYPHTGSLVSTVLITHQFLTAFQASKFPSSLIPFATSILTFKMAHGAPPSYFLPTAPTAPHSFNIFAFSHSPRENHAVYEDFRDILRGRPAVEDITEEETGDIQGLKRSSSMPSFKDSLRKLLRLG